MLLLARPEPPNVWRHHRSCPDQSPLQQLRVPPDYIWYMKHAPNMPFWNIMYCTFFFSVHDVHLKFVFTKRLRGCRHSWWPSVPNTSWQGLSIRPYMGMKTDHIIHGCHDSLSPAWHVLFFDLCGWRWFNILMSMYIQMSAIYVLNQPPWSQMNPMYLSHIRVYKRANGTCRRNPGSSTFEGIPVTFQLSDSPPRHADPTWHGRFRRCTKWVDQAWGWWWMYIYIYNYIQVYRHI